MQYRKTIGDVTLFINELSASMHDSFNNTRGSCKLDSAEDASRLIEEFEDPDGELMHEEESMHNKYEAFKIFKS